MMAKYHKSSPFHFLNPLLQTLRSSTSTTWTKALSQNALLKQSAHSTRHISTTSPMLAGPGAPVVKGKPKRDPRITLIRYHMQHPKTPRPLRLSRLRALRHWTIHRAWMLLRRKKAAAEGLELQRFYTAMRAACEELRNLDPLTAKDSGRLFRVAMGKQGIFRAGGVPIEYARAQTDTPATEAWDHSWKR